MDDYLPLPDSVPVMTLRETVFFPHAVIPLYIFEPRYRQMLEDVLQGNRLFAVVKEQCDDTSTEDESDDSGLEAMCKCATLGIVRAAHKNPDGSTNLVLQGISRVKVLDIRSEDPYRVIGIEPLASDMSAAGCDFKREKQRIARLLRYEYTCKKEVPDEIMDYLGNVDDPDAFLDLTINSVCNSPQLRQELLETLSLELRFQKFRRYLHRRIDRQRLFNRLQGKTSEEEIGLN
jgi:ATP-dependent Lon protease